MNELLAYFKSGRGRSTHKLSPYFDAYDRHFRRFRRKAPVVMEIGVNHGGALQMWRHYFGRQARIIGVDIAEKCRVMERAGFEIYIGDQGSPDFWDEIKSKVPPIDVLIDDGSHRLDHQCITFDCMFGHIKTGGVYLVEDCHSSYRHVHGGGHRKPTTFIEYAKDLVDELNAFWSQDETLPVTQFTRTCTGVHFHDAMVVFDKQIREAPYNMFGGRRPERFTPRRRRVPLAEMEALEMVPKAGTAARRNPATPTRTGARDAARLRPQLAEDS